MTLDKAAERGGGGSVSVTARTPADTRRLCAASIRALMGRARAAERALGEIENRWGVKEGAAISRPDAISARRRLPSATAGRYHPPTRSSPVGQSGPSLPSDPTRSDTSGLPRGSARAGCRLGTEIDAGKPRRRLGELAKRAGRGVTMGRVARAALDKGLDAVSAAMDQEQASAETALPEVQADRREVARLAGQT